MEGEEEATDCGYLNTLLHEDYDENCRVEDQLLFTHPDEVIKASMDGDSGPDTILDVSLKRREILHMKNELNATTLIEEGYRTKDDLLELIFTSEYAIWKTILKQRINFGLRENNENHLDEWEYYAFLKCLWSVHYYDKSPTALFDDDQRSNFGVKQFITLRRFLDILHSLGSPMESSLGNTVVWTPPSEKLDAFTESVDHLGAQLRKLVYVMDCTDKASEHPKIKTGMAYCILCNSSRTSLECNQCKVHLCTQPLENHVHHAMYSTGKNKDFYYSCYEIFHSEGCVFYQ